MAVISIFASGSGGDVRPAVALGQGLRRAGHEVRVATHPPFEAMVAGCGLVYAGVGDNPHELLQSQSGAALAYEGNPLDSLRQSLLYLRRARPVFRRFLEGAWEACRGAEVLLLSLPAFPWGYAMAERMGIPAAFALPQPVSRTGEFPSVFQPFRFSGGPLYNRLTHRVLEQGLYQAWRSEISGWRSRTLGLAPWPRTGPFAELYARRVPFFYGFSPRVVAPPADWPPWHTVTGYWFMEDRDEPLSPALERFLGAGGPVVYVGFGSMGVRRPRRTAKLVVEALRRAGCRGVLLGGEEVVVAVGGAEDMFVVERVSHRRLFPRVAAVVHHGGAGTTAEGLRAGVPGVVIPSAVDQFFWGEKVRALGVGPAPLPRRGLEAGSLARAISVAVGDVRIRENAARMGEFIRAEDGVGRAVEEVEKISGRWHSGA